MTVRELIGLVGEQPQVVLAAFLFPPLIVWILGRIHGRGNGERSPWKYIYALLIYLSVVPGMCVLVLTAYILFFTGESLLDVNLVVYGLPIVSMIATLAVMRAHVDFDAVPGFDRLSGLMVMITISFVFALIIRKTRIWLFFGGSIATFIVFLVAFFALLKWGAYLTFRRRNEPKIKPPSFPKL
jgi:hypothetical protein